jgi:ABC-type transport system involved in multi-copper enzyme maturation permease subunit
VRLIRAELLKARRRQATWVLLAVALALTAVIYLLIGRSLGGVACQLQIGEVQLGTCLVEFPNAYSLMAQFAFALGGLLGIVYAAAFTGADWNWGVVRNVVARGESRARYLLAKAAALAIVLGLGSLVIFVFAFLMTYVNAFVYGIPVASPLRGQGVLDFLANLALGYPVVLERAALGFAVAVVLRSQLAGAVVGVVLYVGEGILTTILTVVTILARFSPGGGGGIPDPDDSFLQVAGPEWFQYLPISVGSQVLNWAPGTSLSPGTGDVAGLFLRPVPLEFALPTLAVYLVVAMALAIVALNRQEIT